MRRASTPREIVTPAATMQRPATAMPSNPAADTTPSPAVIPTATDVMASIKNPMNDHPRPPNRPSIRRTAPAPKAAMAGPPPSIAVPITAGSPT
jgi:hypothetical protein